MYKEKKISKFALICCSFLIALSTLLAINPTWINNVYGTTLCATPPITEVYLDYKNPNLITDYYTYNSIYPAGSYVLYVVSINYTGYTTNSQLQIKLSYDFNTTTGNKDFTFYYFDNTNTLVSSTLTCYFNNSTDSLRLPSSTSSNGVPVIPDLANCFIVPSFSYNNVFCSYNLYQKYLAYREGVSAGAGAYDDGYNAGYTAGQTAGQQTGYQDGYTAGYTEGEGVGYNTGYTEGINTGYTNGQNSVLNHPGDYDLYTQEQYQNNYNTGYQNGENNVINNPEEFDLYTQDQFEGNYNTGYNAGLDVGEQTGYSNGYTDGNTAGYADGYNAGISKDISFKNLIFAVVDVPVETIRSLFNFDLLGFNLYNFFVAILTACVLVILIKLVIKGK